MVKTKFLKVLIMKKIYNNYHLDYYYKYNHLNIIPKTYLNKDIAL